MIGLNFLRKKTEQKEKLSSRLLDSGVASEQAVWSAMLLEAYDDLEKGITSCSKNSLDIILTDIQKRIVINFKNGEVGYTKTDEKAINMLRKEINKRRRNEAA